MQTIKINSPADVCGLKSSFIMLVKQCHKPSPSLPSLHHKSVVCLSFPVMGAITNVINHPSFKTSAFITVMLAYLYQTSAASNSSMIIWLVFKKRKSMDTIWF